MTARTGRDPRAHSPLVSTTRITYPATQPYESIDSAGKITILGSGKATTRVKRRITAAFEGIGPPPRNPTRVPEETVLLP